MIMNLITPDLVWAAIRIHFFNKDDSLSCLDGEKTGNGGCNNCSDKINQPLDNQYKYFQRMFRSEAERGALQGELYHVLRKQGFELIKEYKRACIDPNSGQRGDIAIFKDIDDDYPEVVIEMKHWSAFQGNPSKLVTKRGRSKHLSSASSITYELFDELQRWLHKESTNWPAQLSSGHTNSLVNIKPIYLAFYTEFPIGPLPGFKPSSYSFLQAPSYWAELVKYRNKMLSKKHNLQCKKGMEFLCPLELANNFEVELKRLGSSNLMPNFRYEYIDQKLTIGQNSFDGRLHCFAVWK